MFRKLLASILVMLMCILVLTSCWDQVEIDERLFVTTIGFDKPTEEDALDPFNRYKISVGFRNQSSGMGTDTEISNETLSTVTSEMYTAERMLATRTNKSLFFGHLKVMLIGEDVARDERLFREVLDAVERNPIINRRVSIGIVEGTASEVLETVPILEGNVGQFLADVFRRKDRTQKAPLIDLGEALITLHENGMAIIPRIIPRGEEIKVAGAAVIKNYKMVGWLSSVESNDITIANGEIKFITFGVPHMDLMIPISITDGSSEFEYIETENERKMVINIEMEGDIEMYYINPKEDILDPAFLTGIQNHASKIIKESIEATVEKLQKDFNADVMGFDRYLEKYKPKVWKEIKGEWDEIFPNLTVEVNVETKIRRIGLAK